MLLNAFIKISLKVKNIKNSTEWTFKPKVY